MSCKSAFPSALWCSIVFQFVVVFHFINILNVRFTVCSGNEIQEAIISGLSMIFRIHLSFKNILIFCSDHLLFVIEPIFF